MRPKFDQKQLLLRWRQCKNVEIATSHVERKNLSDLRLLLQGVGWTSNILRYLFWGGVLYSVVLAIIYYLIFRLAVVDKNIRLKSFFVVTQFPQNRWSNRITNLSNQGSEYKTMFGSILFSCLLYPFNCLSTVLYWPVNNICNYVITFNIVLTSE